MMQAAIKFIACAGILYLVYILFLQAKRMFIFNRIYLLASVVLSFAAPFISLTQPAMVSGVNRSVDQVASWIVLAPEPALPDVVWPDKTQARSATIYDSVPEILFIIYALVTLLMLCRFLINLLRMFKLSRRGLIKQVDGCRVILCEGLAVPFSFAGTVYADPQTWNDPDNNALMMHELAHLKQVHSADILFIELVKVFCWFNPFIFLYRRAISLNHEFLADEITIRRYDPVAYQYLLLQKVSVRQQQFSSPFNFFNIKKRLIMINHFTNTRVKLITGFCAIPAMLISALMFSDNEPVNTGQGQSVVPAQLVLSLPDTVKPAVEPVTMMGAQLPAGPGATEADLKAFNEILAKYKIPAPGELVPNQPTTPPKTQQMLEEDRKILEQVYRRMDKKQRTGSSVQFVKSPPPPPKRTPSKSKFNEFKNASVYGVWIDEKKVANTVLENYSNTDFSQANVSKLYGAAKKGRTYTHQLNLMTNEYYKEFVERAKKDSSAIMIVQTRFAAK